MGSGKKQTKRQQEPKANKKTKQKEHPESYFKKNIAWHFGMMDNGGNWCCDVSRLNGYLTRLSHFESQTCEEIFFQQRGDHNHPIPIANLESDAQNRLDELGYNQVEMLHQIGLGGPVRLWGIMFLNIFKILWLDEEHTVYIPYKK